MNRRHTKADGGARRNLKSHTDNSGKPSRTVDAVDERNLLQNEKHSMKIDSGIVNLKSNLKEHANVH